MRRTIYLLLAVLMLVSCGKKEIKQVSQESIIAEEAFALAETVRGAFVKNDKQLLQKNSTEDGYRDIMAGRKLFDSVDLTFTPRWVEIAGTQILLNVAWKSSWTIASRKVDERGMAVFVLEGKPLKVTKILRANPFVLPAQ